MSTYQSAADNLQTKTTVLTYPFTGGAYNFITADATKWDPSGSGMISAGAPTNHSTRLGDGITVPNFWAAGIANFAGCERTTTPSWKITLATSNCQGGWPRGTGGANIIVPIPVGCKDVQIDFVAATNQEALGAPAAGGDFTEVGISLVRWSANTTQPENIALWTISRRNWVAARWEECLYAFSNSDITRDVTGAPGGIFTGQGRFIVRGHEVEIWTADYGSTLTRRTWRSQPYWAGSRSDMFLIIETGQLVAAGAIAGIYIDIKSLSIKATRF